MALSVEERLAALKNRLKKRAELANTRGEEPETQALSLDELIERIKHNSPANEPQLDNAN